MKRAVEVLVGVTFAASLTLLILEWLLDWLVRSGFEDKQVIPTL